MHAYNTQLENVTIPHYTHIQDVVVENPSGTLVNKVETLSRTRDIVCCHGSPQFGRASANMDGWKWYRSGSTREVYASSLQTELHLVDVGIVGHH
ncbi:MAG: hypothetical protein J3R72DRAFT_498069 [Linnemannia gamsii]|nr:MAG: hypothetical protein J3R72DRAFT_498069 [Linnemannia gamsii]